MDQKDFIILRTPQHYSNNFNNPRNLLSGIYKKLKTNKYIKITKNEIFSVSSCEQISQCILDLINKEIFGTYHACEGNEYTWADISIYIASKLNLDINKSVNLKDINNQNRLNSTLVPSSQTQLKSELKNINF